MKSFVIRFGGTVRIESRNSFHRVDFVISGIEDELENFDWPETRDLKYENMYAKFGILIEAHRFG